MLIIRALRFTLANLSATPKPESRQIYLALNVFALFRTTDLHKVYLTSQLQ